MHSETLLLLQKTQRMACVIFKCQANGLDWFAPETYSIGLEKQTAF